MAPTESPKTPKALNASESQEPTVRGFIDYYTERGVIPVSQSLGPEGLAHWQRRTALFMSLGLPPLTFTGKQVLEIGPGTGDNALVTASWDPFRYTLMDANPASLRACAEKADSGRFGDVHLELLDADVNDETSTSQAGGGDVLGYDVVMAEAMIPGQVSPSETFQLVARHVKPGGVLVVTTSDPISTLPELLRRLWKVSLTSLKENFEVQASVGAEIFERHLANLAGVSRPSKDWVIDNILHPWPKTWPFGVDTAIEQAKDEFQFLGSSPRFLWDDRWYKSLVGLEFDFNKIALKRWEEFKLSTLDYRVPASARFRKSEVDAVTRLATEVNELVHDMWVSNSYDKWSQLTQALADFNSVLTTNDQFQCTATSLNDFIEQFPKVIEGDLRTDVRSFGAWWGRGQQYVSFLRTKDYRPDWTQGL